MLIHMVFSMLMIIIHICVMVITLFGCTKRICRYCASAAIIVINICGIIFHILSLINNIL
jgi:hypothetical protein